MAGNEPEERVDTPMVRQSWRRMSFLHWRIDPAEIAPRLPRGMTVDIVDGSAWISLTPFRVENFGLLRLPPVPVMSSFNETNLRTYVRGPDGRDGLWFFSLDVDSIVNAGGGRLGRIPYHLSAMSVQGDGDRVHYRCQRLIGGRAHHDISVEAGDPLGNDRELAELLAGRWRSYVSVAARIVEVPVQHQPWPLRDARLVACDESLMARAGLPRPAEPPLVHFSAGVDAQLGPPRLATG
jgi:uncharacterized protein